VKLSLKFLLPLLALVVPAKSFACAACYGNVSAPMTDGMNWGIFTLLGVIVPVLGGFLAFFIYLIRKSEALANTAVPQNNSSDV
jgi:heme/copper-type cytochrome/quinol oxidase subunit 2